MQVIVQDMRVGTEENEVHHLGYSVSSFESNRAFVECKPETVPRFSTCSFRVCGMEIARKDRSPCFE
jgi:uncharacterized protein (UPF0303 family)